MRIEHVCANPFQARLKARLYKRQNVATAKSCSSWDCRAPARAPSRAISSSRVMHGSIATRLADRCATCCRISSVSFPRASRESCSTTRTSRARRGHSSCRQAHGSVCPCGACGSRPASRPRRSTPPGAWCRSTAACSNRTRCAKPPSATSIRLRLARSFATSASSSLRTPPKVSRESRRWPSSERSIPR